MLIRRRALSNYYSPQDPCPYCFGYSFIFSDKNHLSYPAVLSSQRIQKFNFLHPELRGMGYAPNGCLG